MTKALTALFICFLLPSQPGHGRLVRSDESGTLVILARADDGLIVSTDSRISGPSSGIDADRKIIAVGHESACALSGYLGLKKEQLDVAASMSAWVRDHPDVEAPEALEALSGEAKKVWDSELDLLGVDALGPRRRGSGITLLYCGVYRQGHGQIMFANTYVGWDLRAVVDASRPQIMDRTLIGGEITGRDVSPLLGSIPIHTSSGPVTAELAEAIHQDVEVQKALANLKTTSVDGTKTWSSKDASRLLAALFRVTESTVPDIVAPPNIAYLLRPCGRERFIVESIPADAGCKTAGHSHQVASRKR